MREYWAVLYHLVLVCLEIVMESLNLAVWGFEKSCEWSFAIVHSLSCSLLPCECAVAVVVALKAGFEGVYRGC